LNKRSTIRKVVIIGAWLLTAGGIAMLLIAANRKEAAHYCQRIAVTIKGSGEAAYISKGDILTQLQVAANGPIVQKKIETINVAGLEKSLENHSWIRDAELYFDSRDVLHVIVSERVPVARVFTTTGASFYIDSAGKQMPLLPQVTVRVPVVTSYPEGKMHGRQDSAVVKELTAIAQYINTHPFWSAQIAQIDVTPAGTFELLPVVGNHIIRIGRSDNLEEKLSNLLLFYKQVLRQSGIDKYAVIDVQYKDQVVGSHEKTSSKIDSVQLQKNIQELIKKTKLQAEADSLALLEMAEAASDTVSRKASIPEKPVPAAAARKTEPARKQSKAVEKPKSGAPVPKAVMKKRTQT
jgi:cell division protein FtsQ